MWFLDVFHECFYGSVNVSGVCVSDFSVSVCRCDSGVCRCVSGVCRCVAGVLRCVSGVYRCVSGVLCVGVFRECAGARCVLTMVQYHICRTQCLGIVQQLILSNGGDEDFAALLGLMHTSSPDAIQLKMDIIKVVTQSVAVYNHVDVLSGRCKTTHRLK